MTKTKNKITKSLT